MGVFHCAGPPLSSSPPQMSFDVAVLCPDLMGQRVHPVVIEMVDRDGDPGAAEPRDELGRLFDGLGAVVF